MSEDTLLPFDLPAVKRKKVTADFGGGLISLDGGLVLLRGAERRLGLAETLAGCIREWRNPSLVGGRHEVRARWAGAAQRPSQLRALRPHNVSRRCWARARLSGLSLRPAAAPARARSLPEVRRRARGCRRCR